MVSVTISLPFRGTFHLSLTVLVHYRSTRVFSLSRWPGKLPTESFLHGTQEPHTTIISFQIQGFHLLWLSIPKHSSSLSCGEKQGPTTPRRKRRGLGCSRFAHRYSGNHICFLFLRVLRCFSSPGCLPALRAKIQNSKIRNPKQIPIFKIQISKQECFEL